MASLGTWWLVLALALAATPRAMWGASPPGGAARRRSRALPPSWDPLRLRPKSVSTSFSFHLPVPSESKTQSSVIMEKTLGVVRGYAWPWRGVARRGAAPQCDAVRPSLPPQ